MSEVAYCKLLTRVKSEVEGVGDLAGQKLLYGLSILGVIKDRSILRCCLPGSKKHQEQLQKEYGFPSGNQVKQLVNHLSCHLRVLPI